MSVADVSAIWIWHDGAVQRLRVLVVDDEQLALDDLTWLLRQNESIDDVRTATSGDEALRLIGTGADLDGIFLDIQMPGLSGVDLVRVLRNYQSPPPIAFVTAFDDYALDAFDLNVCDYLVKPVAQDRLDETIRRMAASAPAAPPKSALEELIARVGTTTHTIARDDVVHVEASGDYVRVHTADKSYLVRESISSLTSAWSAAGFVRIHRSYLVKVDQISEVRSTDARRTVVLPGVELPVSRRYLRLVEDHLSNQVSG